MEMQNPVTVSPSALALGGALQKRKLLHPYQGRQQQHRAAEQQHGAADLPGEGIPRLPRDPCAPQGTMAAEPQQGTAGAPGARSTAAKRSRRP